MESLDLKVTVEFTCRNMIDEDILIDAYEGNLMAFMKDMLEDETIVAYSDEEKLVKVEILTNTPAI